MRWRTSFLTVAARACKPLDFCSSPSAPRCCAVEEAAEAALRRRDARRGGGFPRARGGGRGDDVRFAERFEGLALAALRDERRARHQKDVVAEVGAVLSYSAPPSFARVSLCGGVVVVYDKRVRLQHVDTRRIDGVRPGKRKRRRRTVAGPPTRQTRSTFNEGIG